MSSDERSAGGANGHGDRPGAALAQEPSRSGADRQSDRTWPRWASSSGADPRVAAALEEYLVALEAGSPPSREEFLDRHASISGALGECLSGLEFVRAVGWRFDDAEPSASPAGADIPEIPTSDRLGDYRILREVGRGSMGVVYEAEQVSLGRRVALKVLPFASAIDPRQRQRFRLGGDSPTGSLTPTATLPHSPTGNGHGTPAPGPVRDVDGAGSLGRRDFHAIARLGMQAAEALEHAHSLGVVHRDIKPANLMVDSRGELWITDFGLARLRGDSSLTRSGDLVGTLRYMSPEQALARRGVVDQRTDVYALGLTLYELLTLRPAFDAREHHELLRQIAMDDPAPPRRIDPTIPRDLETIVLKAACKEPSGRYATARELADDLARFCEDRPILARRPTVLERGVRWARRHKQIVVTAVAVLVLALGVGAAIIGRQVSKTDKISRQRLTYIHDSFPLIDRFTINYMGQMSGEIPPAGQTDPTIEVYKQALKLYEQAAGITATDPESRTIIARAHNRMGFTYGVWSYRQRQDPNLLAQAKRLYLQSLDEYERLLAERPGDWEVRSWLADAVGEWGFGWFLVMTGKSAEAEPYYRRAIQLRRELVVDPTVDAPKIAFELEKLSSVTTNLAQMLRASGRIGEARQLYRDFVETCTTLADQPIGPGAATRLSAGMFLNNLAWSLASAPIDPAQDPAPALEAARKAVTFDPGNWMYWNTLGVAAYRVGDWKQASEALEKSISLHKEDDASDWLFLAMTRWRQDNRDEARKCYDRAAALIEKNPGKDPLLPRFQAEATELLGIHKVSSGSKHPAKG
jgi:tetratricopeptide (TPR) repeat protein